MAKVFGVFSGILDEARELRHVAYMRTGITHVDAQYLRLKILSPHCATLYGHVSATVCGAEGAIERAIFPEYNDLWTQRNLPELPHKFIGGKVKGDDINLCACLPEYESCRGDRRAEALSIDPPVPSVGFIVQLHLAVSDLEPGTSIRGIIALSDGYDLLTERGHEERKVDTSPAENGADLSNVTVAGDSKAGVEQG
jgi:hypothetical protein